MSFGINTILILSCCWHLILSNDPSSPHKVSCPFEIHNILATSCTSSFDFHDFSSFETDFFSLSPFNSHTKNSDTQTTTTMHKSLVLLATLAASALAAPFALISNNDGSKSKFLDVPDGKRYCFCLTSTQTARIDGTYGGDVKLFSTSDCTGNYANGRTVTNNAQWVNSISLGASGISSTWGAGKSCSWY